MKSIEHYEQLAREAKAEGRHRHHWTCSQLTADGDPAVIRCGCGEYASLGKASDTPDVRIEVRAAAIANGGHAFTHGVLRSMTWFEGAGYDRDGDDDGTTHENKPNLDNFGAPVDSDDWHAGYLAREIVDHAKIVANPVAIGDVVRMESADGAWETVRVVAIDVLQCLKRTSDGTICTAAEAFDENNGEHCMPFQNYGKHAEGFEITGGGASGFLPYDGEGSLWEQP